MKACFFNIIEYLFIVFDCSFSSCRAFSKFQSQVGVKIVPCLFFPPNAFNHILVFSHCCILAFGPGKHAIPK